MYQANVYKIMIGSPSDIKEEITIAREVLNNWNNLNSEKNRIVLLPIHWSISSYPAMGKHPQKLLNEQLVEKSDLMICIFGTRLGSPTDTEISGTVEEIKEHRKSGKDVMIFFKQSVDDLSSVDLQQLQGIKDFKESIKNDVLWFEFMNASDFKNKLSDALQRYVSEHWGGNTIGKNVRDSTTAFSFSDSEKEILTKWVNSGDMYYYTQEVTDGVHHFFGTDHYFANKGLEEARMDDFVSRMRDIGFIEEYEKDGFGVPKYKLKKAAYDYVDTITEKNN